MTRPKARMRSAGRLSARLTRVSSCRARTDQLRRSTSTLEASAVSRSRSAAQETESERQAASAGGSRIATTRAKKLRFLRLVPPRKAASGADTRGLGEAAPARSSKVAR